MSNKKDTEKNAKYNLEADILSNLRLSADFADLAEGHYKIMDDNGFKYSVDRYLDHARLVSEKLKKLREVKM
jgi:hypothetical protein